MRATFRRASNALHAKAAAFCSSDLISQNLWQIPHFRYNMKRLPIFTLAASFIVAMSYVWSTLLNAQETPPEATKPANPTETAQPSDPTVPARSDVPQGPRTAAGSPARSGPVELRRNEKSGASASVTLETARDKLTAYRTVKAKIVETIVLKPRRFQMKGTYLQGTDLKLRLEYELQVGGTKASLLEVCDGQILWTWHRIGKDQSVTRRNVRQILSARDSNGRTDHNTLVTELGLGGLPGLLASIQKSVRLDKQWEQTVPDGDRTLIVVEGGWKDSFRQRVVPDGAPEQQLPQWVPDRIRVYFEQVSLFPRRILYLKRDDSQVHHPMVMLDFEEVEWDGDVDPNSFTFVPPAKVVAQDVTQSYIKQFSKEAAAEPPK